ncbi:hypothetical protein E4L96_23270 [Massilia arenosa]|uniref:Acyltransferase 3 domain-containing protein n=1 Tax=Zemynaea arenosa TaxID=2561931 RepID=A0A4Y9RP49_9BURK|nr:acyltransferase family protein [Massilia arenosa]TFW10632.1 hypothetical protein E4L96_23270 [Massilia arenosa]
MTTDKQSLAAGSARLPGLDAVRAFALVLGVVLHATMSFFPERVWLVDDSASSTGATVLFYVIHMLRMLTFFLLAGYVARISLHKLGARAFFRDRALRIGLPLVAGWPLVFAAFTVAIIIAAVIANGGAMPAGKPPEQGFGLRTFPLTHLWFLYLLALLYAGLALARPLLQALDLRTGGWLGTVAGRVTSFLLQPWGPLVLGLPLAGALYAEPGWIMWFGIPTPDHGFLPAPAPWVAYGGAFLFGWLAQRQGGAVDRWRRHWAWHLGVALALTGACLGMAGLAPRLLPATPGSATLAYAVCYGIGAWSWAFALTGLGLRFFDRPHPLRQYLADASYWIYLVHLPLVVLLQGLVSQQGWPWALKLASIVAGAFAVMLATYAWMVRGTWVGAVLNGRRKGPLRARARSSQARPAAT